MTKDYSKAYSTKEKTKPETDKPKKETVVPQKADKKKK